MCIQNKAAAYQQVTRQTNRCNEFFHEHCKVTSKLWLLKADFDQS
jgi:hypothetical protein